MKHSKGPWNRRYGNYVYQGERHNPSINQRLIAICEPNTRSEKDWEETFANAALIGHAPTMLDLLIKIKEQNILNKDDEEVINNILIDHK